MKSKTGFTLIELLISISIIAILAALGLSAYQSVYRASRDAQRKSDLKLIQSALEDYHADQLYYPYTVIPGSSLISPDGKKTYITKVPNAPTGGPNYAYVAGGSSCSSSNPQGCTTYCLFTSLEITSNLPTSDPGCTTPISPLNYGVTKP